MDQGSASMGPRKRIRGEDVSTDAGLGLVPQLQWGRGKESAERYRPRHPHTSAKSFSGAAEMNPRGYGPQLPMHVSKRCFKGAAEKNPRRADSFCARYDPRPALQWGRGKESAESGDRADTRREREIGFNGAAEKNPRRG